MSKLVKEALPKLVKHRHCIVCHSPVLDLSREFCSPKCQEGYARTEKRRKLTTLVMLLIFPAVFLLMMLLRQP